MKTLVLGGEPREDHRVVETGRREQAALGLDVGGDLLVRGADVLQQVEHPATDALQLVRCVVRGDLRLVEHLPERDGGPHHVVHVVAVSVRHGDVARPLRGVGEAEAGEEPARLELLESALLDVLGGGVAGLDVEPDGLPGSDQLGGEGLELLGAAERGVVPIAHFLTLPTYSCRR
jgi:hypothetical protein